MKALIIWAVVAGIGYIIKAFTDWEFNPATWKKDDRAVLISGSFGLTIILILLYVILQ